MLMGIPIKLYEKTVTGYNDMREPIYTETAETIGNVLVAPVSSEEVIQDLDLYGIKTVYQLAIPKGDNHDWKNKKVLFFNQVWQTVGEPLEGIESLIPLGWNKKVKVAKYE